MKRVHYLAGAAGLAPVAFGLATGPAAHAAGAAVPPPWHEVKTVSLHHVLSPAATGNTAASSSASASSATAPGVLGISASVSTTRHCTGSIGTSASHDNLSEKFWYSPGGCIGTVEGAMVYNKTVDKCMWGRIYHDGQLEFKLYRVCRTGSPGGVLHATWHVWRTFATPVEVCMKSTYDTVGACRTVD